ncbi:serine/arginine repetitive matrix protein 1-like [Leguminivora glycinivorella]|uniref:serine/arginine repetitive matrix protein 1-like n=1 Tax=Leguminivora glycinivorella TaxID=1035111 RepID=UPI00200D2B6B|nr:serine/arginine repetitive matrix protein 1-like [Leguminivora glycinivorella]
MGSSSDEQFAWTNTSKDDSDTEPEKTYDGESESGKNYKKKLQKELFQNGDRESEEEEGLETPRVRHKLKKPKQEKCSPSPAPERRVKRESLANGHDAAAAEHMLRVRVKQEHAARKRRASAAAEPDPDREPTPDSEQPRKKKKKRDKERRKRVSSTTEAPDGPAETLADAPAESRPSPRKKNKTKIKQAANDESYFDGWWKFEAGETTVQPRPAAPPRSPPPEAKHYTSKEFVSDRDSSDDEPGAFEERSHPDTDSKPRKASQSTASPRRPRLSERITFEEDSRSGPEPPAPQQTTPKKSLPADRRRISDRITFEESSSEAERAPPVPAPARPSPSDGGRLGRFLRAHAHMHPVLGEFPAGAAVTADDDVWIVRCPRDLPASALRGATLDVAFKSKVKAGGRAYEVCASGAGGDERAAVLAPAARGAGFCVRAVAVRGHLRLRAKLPRPRAPLQADEGSPERVPLPPTRARHPLLGADYERALPPPAVRRRLARAGARDRPAPARDEADADGEVRRDKKKKKKKHKERPEPEPSPEPSPDRKSRKRRRSSRAEAEARSPAREERAESPPRKKKVKKEKKWRDDAAVWDSERAIEESLFNY